MATHSSVLPGESQGWGSLVGCCLWGHTESDTTEATQQQQQQQQQQQHHSTMALCLYGRQEIPAGTLAVAEFLTPRPLDCLLTANCPLPRFALQIPYSSTQPPSIPVDTPLRLGHSGLWHAPSVQISFCPAYHRLIVGLSSGPLNLPSVPGDLPPVRGFPQIWEPLLQLPPGAQVPFHFFFSFSFSLFCPTQLHMGLSCQRSSASVQQVSVKIVPFINASLILL